MKNLLIIAALFLVSCTKQSVKPITATESNEIVTSGASFIQGSIDTIHLSQGLNTIKTGYFNVSDSCKVYKFTLQVNGTPDLRNISFYINGGHVGATCTFENGIITIVPRNKVLSSGSYSYLVIAKVNYSSPFQVILTDALFALKNGSFLPVSGLPDYGNVFN